MVELTFAIDYSRRSFISMGYYIELPCLITVRRVNRLKLLTDNWIEFWNSHLMHRRKDWSNKLDDASWACCTVYKTPIRMSPNYIVFGKCVTYQLSLSTEHIRYWNIQHGLREGWWSKILTTSWIRKIQKRSLRKCVHIQRKSK